MNAVDPLLPRSLLGQELRKVREEIDALFVELLDDSASSNPTLTQAMRFAALGGGKRLRPLLTVAAAQLFDVSRERALAAGLAAECVHVQSLVHDDLPCMDDGQLRRGKPTVHRAFGEATAVIAGDALLGLAFQVLANESTHADPAIRMELVQELSFAIGPLGMAAGQMFDLAGTRTPPDIAEVSRTQYLKTGALIGWAVQAGAILGRASLKARSALRGYAYCLGVAFQVADDVLDASGGAGCGKDVGKDGAQNKATFVSLFGMDEARRRAEKLATRAKEYVRGFGADAALLLDIADFAVRRDR